MTEQELADRRKRNEEERERSYRCAMRRTSHKRWQRAREWDGRWENPVPEGAPVSVWYKGRGWWNFHRYADRVDWTQIRAYRLEHGTPYPDAIRCCACSTRSACRKDWSMSDEYRPLTQEETLGAFIAFVNAISAAGLSPGYGRITEAEEAGIDLTFSLPAFVVRKACAADPEAFKRAERHFASGTLTEGGDVEQAPGESLSGPTAESGDAQPTPVSDPISNKGER